jgi:hypothetical protein
MPRIAGVLPLWHMHSYCPPAVCSRIQKQQCCAEHTRPSQAKLHTCRSQSSYWCAAPSPRQLSNISISSRHRTPRPAAAASPGTKAPEMCVIVDENNNFVGSATRKETGETRHAVVTLTKCRSAQVPFIGFIRLRSALGMLAVSNTAAAAALKFVAPRAASVELRCS